MISLAKAILRLPVHAQNTHSAQGFCTTKMRSWQCRELEVIVGTENPCLQKKKGG